MMEHTIGPIQILSSLFEALQEHTHRLEREKTISRIWNQDHSVWGIDEAQSLDRLGWLRLPDTMPREIPKLTRFSEQILNEGFTHYELVATLAGEPLYESCGYVVEEEIDWESSKGVFVPLKRMVKNLI